MFISGPVLYGAMIVVKQFPVRKCGHEKKPISAAQCIHSLISKDSNADHLIVATQDGQLSDQIRTMRGVPLLYISHNTILMEKESEASRVAAKDKISTATSGETDAQFQRLKDLKRLEGLEEEPKMVKRKKKGPKGPNPLSCKKRKAKLTSGDKKKKMVAK